MQRVPFVAGNWKMFTSVDDGVALCLGVRDAVRGIAGVDTVVCPPFTHLGSVRDALAGSRVSVGAQNVHWEAEGAFTGEVSPAMLSELAEYVIIGHSERRQLFGETDDSVNRKLKAALNHGLLPIFAVGETLDEREAGRTEEVLTRQVTRGLDGVPWDGSCTIAYEPVWAIGTGLAATAKQANATIRLIRGLVGEIAGSDIAQAMRIQYGGSVKPDNAAELFAQPEIDGALVGGASLDAKAFAAIVRAASDAAS